jgi:hypothetical protein
VVCKKLPLTVNQFDKAATLEKVSGKYSRIIRAMPLRRELETESMICVQVKWRSNSEWAWIQIFFVMEMMIVYLIISMALFRQTEWSRDMVNRREKCVRSAPSARIFLRHSAVLLSSPRSQSIWLRSHVAQALLNAITRTPRPSGQNTQLLDAEKVAKLKFR